MPPKKQRVWVFNEEDAMLDCLEENKAEAGDGVSFKRPTFQKAAEVIAPLLVKGLAKDWASCQNKWDTMRKAFGVVNAVKELSGVHWSDETGASIGPEGASMWTDYTAKHPLAKPFRNKGYPHYAKIARLLPTSTSTTTVFHPLASQSASAPPATGSSPLEPTPSPEDEPAAVSDDEGDVTATPIAAPTSGKRVREPSTPVPQAKRIRTNAGSTALQAMATSIDNFTLAITAALTAPANAVDPTPRRRVNAVTTATKKETWLTHDQLMALVVILQKDTAACDVYLSFIDYDEMRMDWVAKQINLPSILVPLI